VREDRTRLLWKFRCNEQQRDDTLKCALEDIVSDEFHKMKRRDEVLWEYEGPPLTTCPDQYEEILLEMQRIFYEDLKSQPQGKQLALNYMQFISIYVCVNDCA